MSTELTYDAATKSAVYTFRSGEDACLLTIVDITERTAKRLLERDAPGFEKAFDRALELISSATASFIENSRPN